MSAAVSALLLGPLHNPPAPPSPRAPAFDALDEVWLSLDPAPPRGSRLFKLFAPDGCPVPPGNPPPAAELPRPLYEMYDWPQDARHKLARIFSPMLRRAPVRARNLVAKHVLSPLQKRLLAREVVLDRNRVEQKNRRSQQSRCTAAKRSTRPGKL